MDSNGLSETLAQNQLSFSAPNALILGNGGAAQAVKAALQSLSWQYQIVSRQAQRGDFTYDNLPPARIAAVQAIINTTPLGMHPNVRAAPAINYEAISPQTLCFDLVYNPEHTAFMQGAEQVQAFAKNGLDMLHYQADRAWEIWQQA